MIVDYFKYIHKEYLKLIMSMICNKGIYEGSYS